MKRFPFLAAAVLSATTARAEPLLVDLELALMVDVSRSVSYDELEIQRRGYAAALRSEALADAVASGAMGRIAITYVEWAGSQRVIVPWQLVETGDDLATFADALSLTFNPTMRRTSISEALAFATASLNSNDFDGIRRVIDVSGDGPNNQGRGVERMRDETVAQGIVINGLPLLTEDGLWSQWSIDDLDVYYRDCVIGGPGAFVVPVLGWEDFADAVLQKLVMEVFIGSAPPEEQIIPVQYEAGGSYDCFIGEKMWEQRSRDWNMP
ncbi:DUF1194 domain-containing protein [Maritimibacter sp. UBA3975]|uniref:DUF1194 domain-containing protein n=1 Tax=Maritimibacter sp. UBA3975 TaxID=1946833 RepID=UPI000C096F0E|nr:DUF1194 domain-containing protein [Maritimibacter sp. UBA3975]MAM62711.1 hypothetical protein [Maritimibacter sp.]|tara:strand:+ start:5149 stop:5949 length:801 start_codon:yes stop_codon:yes gene_type:complete